MLSLFHARCFSLQHTLSSLWYAFTSRCLVPDPNNVLFYSCHCWPSAFLQLTHGHNYSWWWLTDSHSQLNKKSESSYFKTGSFLPIPLRPATSLFFQLNTFDYSPYVTPSLTRGWVCHLQLLLAHASAVIMTIFYCLRFNTHPTWRARSLYLFPPRNRVVLLYHQALVPFSSPPTTRRAMVEVFEPASTQGPTKNSSWFSLCSLHMDHIYNNTSNNSSAVACLFVTMETCLLCCCLAMDVLLGLLFQLYLSRHK
jgi:hypothetical protein